MPILLGALMDENPAGTEPSVMFTATYSPLRCRDLSATFILRELDTIALLGEAF